MRRQLVVLVASVTALVVIAFLVPLALLVRELAQDSALSAARQDVQNVALLVGVLQSREELASVVELADERTGRRTTVFLPGGATVGAGASPTANVQRAQGGLAFDASVAAGREVLQPVATAQGPAVVRTFVPAEQLRRGVRGAWALLAALGLGLIAVAVLVADRLARSIARPLLDLARAADELGSGRLDTRVQPDGPAEVRQLGTVVNGLAGRIQALLRSEREVVADLSHRLRTPITTLRLDAEALRDREEAERIGADVDALEAAVTEVIREARRHAASAPPVADAVAVVRERVEFWGVLAEDQGRTLSTDLPPGELHVAVGAGDLAAAVDALLQNVLAHTPEGTAFAVRLRAGVDTVTLTVEDDGPGFADASAPSRGRSGAGSTGLGLDIARRTAQASGGRLCVGSGASGGARVELRLGRPARGS
jgi:signal transduction histidine kinase